MDAGRIEALADLLTPAETAHGVYEATALGGVYDQDWPRWYAAYAVDHGVETILGRPVTADALAGSLAEGWEASQRADPGPVEGWATWTARWLLAARS